MADIVSSIQPIFMSYILPAVILFAVVFFALRWLAGRRANKGLKQDVLHLEYGQQLSHDSLSIRSGCIVDDDAKKAWFFDTDAQIRVDDGDVVVIDDRTAIPLYLGRSGIKRRDKVMQYGFGGLLTRLAEGIWSFKSNTSTQRADEEKNQEVWKIAIGGVVLIILVVATIGLFTSGDLSMPW